MLIHFTPLHALARAGQFPVDKAGRLSKPLGAGLKQQLLLRPDSGGPCLPPRAGLTHTEARGGKGRALLRGAECMFNESPKVAEGERLWQPQAPLGPTCVISSFPWRLTSSPLGTPAARPGQASRAGTQPRWLEGLRPSVSIQNPHAGRLNSVPTLSWLSAWAMSSAALFLDSFVQLSQAICRACSVLDSATCQMWGGGDGNTCSFPG